MVVWCGVVVVVGSRVVREGKVCGKRIVFDRGGGLRRTLGGRSLFVIHVAIHLRNLACDGGVKRCAEEGWRGVKGVKVNGTIPGFTSVAISMKGYILRCYQYC